MKNPYEDSVPYSDRHPITVRVSQADFFYIRGLFPAKTGIFDQLLSTLFHTFINDLKSAGLDSKNTDHIAWNISHPTHEIVEELLRRRTAGLVAGNAGEEPGARDVEREAGGIHPALCGTPLLSSDSQGGHASGTSATADLEKVLGLLGGHGDGTAPTTAGKQ